MLLTHTEKTHFKERQEPFSPSDRSYFLGDQLFGVLLIQLTETWFFTERVLGEHQTETSLTGRFLNTLNTSCF